MTPEQKSPQLKQAAWLVQDDCQTSASRPSSVSTPGMTQLLRNANFDWAVWRIVLGSRSVRRRDLLGWIVPADCLEVLPPRSSVEAGFAGLDELLAIEQRLREITRTKACDVLEQVHGRPPLWAGRELILSADTDVVVTDEKGACLVLGQPPDDSTWQDVVRDWFLRYYAGRSHHVLTALRGETRDGQVAERLVCSTVEFRPDVERWLDWYLATGEPRGKAGGYGVQGAGSIFVTRVTGSLTNVVGLPLEAVLEILEELAT